MKQIKFFSIFFFILSSLVFLVSCRYVSEPDYSTKCFTMSSDRKTITGLSTYGYEQSSIIIPDSITNIGFKAFYDCDNLVNITISDSVISIDKAAFWNCSNLTSITMGKNIISIGDMAFCGCNKLIDIKIPDSVTSIGEGAFQHCSNITSVSIGNSVTSIGKDTFDDCSNLVNVIIGNSVTSIGKSAFGRCSSLISIKIPNGVTSIGESAFASCRNLASVIIPDSVTSIGKSAFGGCSSLISIIIPDSITSVTDDVFSGCSNLIKITIPNSVTSIEKDAFNGCYKLVEVINKSALSLELGSTSNGYIAENAKQIISDESESKLSTDTNGFITYNDGTDIWLVNYIGNDTEITIPSNITKINEYAFYNCSLLTSIEIPNSVTNIEYCAFEGCFKLVEVINKSSLNFTIGSEDYGCIAKNAKQVISDEKDSKLSTDTNGFITYNDGTDIWLVNYIGNDAKIIIPNNVTKINDNAFYVILYISIGPFIPIVPFAFSDYSNLTNIIIPNSVTSIGDSAFYNCTSLTNIVIPNSVTSIGKSAFSACNKLSKVYYKGIYPYTDTITSLGTSNEYLINATWYYFTSNGASETESGNWWYYDTDGITIIEKVIE